LLFNPQGDIFGQKRHVIQKSKYIIIITEDLKIKIKPSLDYSLLGASFFARKDLIFHSVRKEQN